MADLPHPKGRGSSLQPPNRFETTHREANLDYYDRDPEAVEQLLHPATEYLPDQSRSVISENDSPDVPFRYSLNPYRGCVHGCAYCYARPTHEYLGYNAGLDFETRIMVKEKAPHLFREFLSRDKWQPESITLSGVTDCYQPAERQYGLTRGCLEVAWEARQPIGIVTKNALVLRDKDILSAMAAVNLVHVNISITTLDRALARTMEPRTSGPEGRLRAVKELSEAGVPVRVLVAPVIPGLNDSEIPAILAEAKRAGARGAGYILVRLPWTVAPVFQEFLTRALPEKAQRIMVRIKATRSGNVNDPRFGSRMKGSGEIADQIGEMFRLFAHRYGLDGGLPKQDCTIFRTPLPRNGQLRLF